MGRKKKSSAEPIQPTQPSDLMTQIVQQMVSGGSPPDFSRPGQPTPDHFPPLSREPPTIRLSEKQRKVILERTNISPPLRNKLLAAKGDVAFDFTDLEFDELAGMVDALLFTSERAKDPVILSPAEKSALKAVMKQFTEIFDYFRSLANVDEVDDGNSEGRELPPLTDLLFQFKITLKYITPKIWRRVIVPDCQLIDLHDVIQTAMGWYNCHLHSFTIDDDVYGSEELRDDDPSVRGESAYLLSELFPKQSKGLKFSYEYDFGDGWEHQIVFEGCPERDVKTTYPLCVKGARNCPPEDSGGPHMYGRLLNPSNDPDDEFSEWVGDWDPDTFDAQQVTQSLRPSNPSETKG